MMVAISMLVFILGQEVDGARGVPYAPQPEVQVLERLEQWWVARELSVHERERLRRFWEQLSATASSMDLTERAWLVIRQSDQSLHKWDALTAGAQPWLDSVKFYVVHEPHAELIAPIILAHWGKRWAERRWYDEAWSLLSQVDLRQCPEPAGVLFYKAVCALGLLMVPEAEESLHDLLEVTEGVPQRYQATAQLMLEELKLIQQQPLGKIAQLMSDSERRLELGRAGDKVQSVQEQIIIELDELIKKLEAQSGGGGGSGSSNQSNQSSNPAADSSVKGSTAPGETDPKKFARDKQWGNLPEKQQTEAKNLLNRQFPSHYQQAIEMYFRKMATKPASTKSETPVSTRVP